MASSYWGRPRTDDKGPEEIPQYRDGNNNNNDPNRSHHYDISAQRELLDMLHRLQSSRLDDQRCSLPLPLRAAAAAAATSVHKSAAKDDDENGDNASSNLEAALREVIRVRALGSNGALPLVALVNRKDFWVEGHGSGPLRRSGIGVEYDEVDDDDDDFWDEGDVSPVDEVELSTEAGEACSRIFRECFVGSEHYNFAGSHDSLGPFVLSVQPLFRRAKGSGDPDGGPEDDDYEGIIPTGVLPSSIASGPDLQYCSTNRGREQSPCVRAILRLRTGSTVKVLRPPDYNRDGDSGFGEDGSVASAAASKVPVAAVLQAMASDHPEGTMPTTSWGSVLMDPAVCPSASKLIMEYDKHEEIRHFKFGLMYQRAGQVTEEEMLNNESHSEALTEFMGWLGGIRKLSEHSGFRGGLDTKHGQTGEHLLYDQFRGHEVVFHVSTLLPFNKNDRQQLQRKRHIGNDIVALVFQDGEATFSPEMVTSHFLHAFIVVRPVVSGNDLDLEDDDQEGPRRGRRPPRRPSRRPDQQVPKRRTMYKVTVVARKDVPEFGPGLPASGIFRGGRQLKEFLLTKLINGERACYKAERFETLTRRTRSALLTDLVRDLKAETEAYLGKRPPTSSTSLPSSGATLTSSLSSSSASSSSMSTSSSSTSASSLPTQAKSMAQSGSTSAAGNHSSAHAILTTVRRALALNNSSKDKETAASTSSSQGMNFRHLSHLEEDDEVALGCKVKAVSFKNLAEAAKGKAAASTGHRSSLWTMRTRGTSAAAESVASLRLQDNHLDNGSQGEETCRSDTSSRSSKVSTSSSSSTSSPDYSMLSPDLLRSSRSSRMLLSTPDLTTNDDDPKAQSVQQVSTFGSEDTTSSSSSSSSSSDSNSMDSSSSTWNSNNEDMAGTIATATAAATTSAISTRMATPYRRWHQPWRHQGQPHLAGSCPAVPTTTNPNPIPNPTTITYGWADDAGQHRQRQQDEEEVQRFRIQDSISRLKVEKLDLLREILLVQHEARRLKDRESQLRGDLTAASQEIEYLKAQSAFFLQDKSAGPDHNHHLVAAAGGHLPTSSPALLTVVVGGGHHQPLHQGRNQAEPNHPIRLHAINGYQEASSAETLPPRDPSLLKER